jgi:hypothetical protein
VKSDTSSLDDGVCGADACDEQSNEAVIEEHLALAYLYSANGCGQNQSSRQVKDMQAATCSRGW